MAKSTRPSKPTNEAATASAPYTVLARRYRSREFDELVGQEPIVETLRRAIAQNRVAHAYLFTGTRGVGKTSTARLFAKALNATSDLSECAAISDAILRGDDMDVIEIDAASNTGVDNVRELIANAGVQPARCPFKIYIIDEAHMLTKAAFNALLKIMEEPPRHVKFILCTTEPEKIPATIQSRCQRFDFRSLPTAKIAGHLRDVLEREGVRADAETVLQIARLANGSVRDALSLLDRVLATAEGELTSELLERTLGVPGAALVVDLVEAIGAGDGAAALRAGDELLQRGHSVDRAIDVLIDHFRNLLIAQVCGEGSPLVERAGDVRAALVRQAARFDAVGLVHAIALCEACGRSARVSSGARALFDALLVRLALSERTGTEQAAEVGASASRPAAESRAALSEKKNRAPEVSDAAKPMPAPPLVTAAAPPPAAALPASTPPLDLETIWNSVLRAVETGQSRAIVEAVRPIAFDGRALRVRVVAEQLRGMLGDNPALLSDIVRKALDRSIVVVIEPPDRDEVRQAAPSASTIEEVRRHPLVREAMDLFETGVAAVSEPRRAE